MYAEAGPDTGTVCVVTLNEDGTETYEYIDVDVEEKPKAEEEAQAGRNVRPHFEAPMPAPQPGPFTMPLPPFAVPIPPMHHPGSFTIPSGLLRTMMKPPVRDDRPTGKFCLASDLHEQLNLDRLMNCVLKTEVPVELKQLLSVAPELSNRVGDALRHK